MTLQSGECAAEADVGIGAGIRRIKSSFPDSACARTVSAKISVSSLTAEWAFLALVADRIGSANHAAVIGEADAARM